MGLEMLCNCQNTGVFIKVINTCLELEETQHHCSKCKRPISEETKIN